MANVVKMVDVANQVVVAAHHFLKVRENMNKRGGYLTVLNQQRSGEVVLMAKVGQVSAEKCLKYKTLSAEKAWRLYSHIGHWRSFETRDEFAYVRVIDESRPHHDPYFERWGHWAGAVRGHRYIWSFSGFPEMLDEAMMFALAIKMGDMKRSWAVERFANSNECLVPFLDHSSCTQ